MGLSRGFPNKRGPLLKRVFGLGLMIFSALGLVISLLGLVAVLRLNKPVAQSADDALALTLTALDTTGQTLGLLHSALGEAQDALGVMETVVQSTEDGLQNTGALIGSLSDALAGDLPPMISNSQDSLSAAEEGAAVIERMLYGLNVISALTGVTYDPDESLTESLARLNDNLDVVPRTLANVDENLNAVQENLNGMQAGFTDVTPTLEESEAILVEAQATVDDYISVIDEVSLRTRSLRASLPNWIRTATFALYFLLIWLAISQIGLLWQGWEMVSYHPAQIEDRLHQLEETVEKLRLQGEK